MHPESMNEMKAFADKYVKPGAPVLDVGSLDINGSYRGLFPEGMYQGLDLIPGPNVDVVAEPYHWPLEDEHYGAVISGQAFEHIEHPDQTMKEINRVLAPGGFVCIIAPSTGPTHEYPIDYRRYNEQWQWSKHN